MILFTDSFLVTQEAHAMKPSIYTHIRSLPLVLGIVSLCINCATSGQEPPMTSAFERAQLGEAPEADAPIVEQGKRWQSSQALSPNAIAVLTNALDTDFPDDDPRVNAYDFHLFSKGKQISGWNFPWDIPASNDGAFTLSYEDMRAMLAGVRVRDEMGSLVWIPWSQFLAKSVSKLSTYVINTDAGEQRLAQIAYCIRNFLAVAKKYQMSRDIYYLQLAGHRLLDMYNAGSLKVLENEFLGVTVDDAQEVRSAKRALAELQIMVH